MLMKAIVCTAYGGPDVLKLEEVETPRPKAGEVLVRTLCSGVSAGTERLVLGAAVPPEIREAMALPSMQGGFELPISYGYAAVGVIDELGEGVAPSRRGARVLALHPHHDRFVVAEGALRPLPLATPPERAVLAPNLETAVNAVWDAGVGLGDRVMVTGLGAVGLLVTFAAARAGASVVGVDPDAGRRELARALGAARATDHPERSDLAAADALVEASGSPAALAGLVAGAGVEAQIVIASWYGTRPVELGLGGSFHPHRVTLRSTQVASIAPARRGRWTIARRWDLVCELLVDERLDRLLAPPTPLAQAPALYAALARGDLRGAPQQVLDHRDEEEP